MPNIDLMPIAGIDTVSKDTNLVVTENRKRRVFVRDAVNVDIRNDGDFAMRKGMRRVTSTVINSLWHSRVHDDTFGEAGGQWVRVRPDWNIEALAEIGTGPVYHIELNQKVYAAGDSGIFMFAGVGAQQLTLQTPSQPVVMTGAGGSLPKGEYAFAVSWLRDSVESQLSDTVRVQVEDEGVTVAFPMCFDNSVTATRLYMSTASGAELLRVGDYTGATETIPTLPKLGMPAPFRFMGPMPSGRYLSYWRGRLLTASANVLRFSEPLAYHIHDPRHGFVQMPQRITFVLPVFGGIWVGQVDHVAFLRGDEPNALSLEKKQLSAPIPGSAVVVDALIAGEELAQQGDAALWLSASGYVIGGANGEASELHKSRLDGVTGTVGSTALLGQRVVTAVV